ncbi:hypothetical protein AKJ16_DCAP03296 [Drosera capensis]
MGIEDSAGDLTRIGRSFFLVSATSASSLALVKGNAWAAQIHIMWIAFGFTTLPCESSTTSSGLLLKCQTSLMYLTAARSINEGLCNQGRVKKD